MQQDNDSPRTSEWLKIMLEEIERKEQEARLARDEEVRRRGDRVESPSPAGSRPPR